MYTRVLSSTLQRLRSGSGSGRWYSTCRSAEAPVATHDVRKPNLLGVAERDLQTLMTDLELPASQAAQVYRFIYKNGTFCAPPCVPRTPLTPVGRC